MQKFIRRNWCSRKKDGLTLTVHGKNGPYASSTLGGNLCGWQASCKASIGSVYFQSGGGGHAGQSSHGGWTIQFTFNVSSTNYQRQIKNLIFLNSIH